VIFWGEMLGNHPRKEKLEHNKTTLLIQIERVSIKSFENIRGVSNNSSEHIREVGSNFSNMYLEGFFISSRSLDHLQGTPLIILKELEVTPRYDWRIFFYLF
jgi:hypothetical protein